MSTTYASKFRNRVYTRRFDHAEARRRYKAGETLTELAREYGVSPEAVRYAVDDRTRRRMVLASMDYQSSGKCEKCGKPCSKAPNKVSRCKSCADDRRVTTVRKATLKCVLCKQWKRDDAFNMDTGQPRRRNRHASCVACDTSAKRAWREVRKVPCSGCGVLVLHEIRRPKGINLHECPSCARRRVAAEKKARLAV